VRLNRLGTLVTIYEADATGKGEVSAGTFDVVLANITARTNAALAPFHAGSLAPGGRLVASGILDDTADLVRQAFAAAALPTLDVRQDGDWVAIHAAHQP
jgi:ribosomal protein L11 methyltransferase